MGVDYLNPNVHATRSDATCRNKIGTRLPPREEKYYTPPAVVHPQTHNPRRVRWPSKGRGEAVGVLESERVAAGRVRGPLRAESRC